MSYDTPNKGYTFVSWTNGNGLTDASGTFTMPNSNVDVVANYVQSTVHISFAHSGLSNINAGVTVLNIDGVNYDYWQVQQTNFQWFIGSTHTITAATSITGWDSVTHWFSGWTNGDGLTGASGTYTVPDHDTVITANYGLTQPPTDTALTISCTPQSVNSAGTETTDITGALTSSGTGIAGKTVSLSYFDGVAWNPIGTATTEPTEPTSTHGTSPIRCLTVNMPLKQSSQETATTKPAPPPPDAAVTEATCSCCQSTFGAA